MEGDLLGRLDRWIAHLGDDPTGAGRASPDNDFIYLLRDARDALARIGGSNPTDSIKWLRSELFALCEATEDEYGPIGRGDTETKHGAFARGRAYEAKSLRREMGDRFSIVLRDISRVSLAPTDGGGE
jgi:hypothetical protein